MAKMTWTEQQKKVIDARKRNLLVSAAAGSGKTAVLVERILQMITDSTHPINIDQLLIVTFTKAAAGEMRDRIGKAIENRVLEEPENEHLQKQMNLLYNAQITTIDSFCIYVIQNYFHTIDLDPSFRVADEAEMTLLKSDIIGQLLEDKYEEADADFLDFVECYAAAKSDQPIEDLILKLYQFSMSNPYPKEWLLLQVEQFEITDEMDLESREWMKELNHRIHLMLNEARQMSAYALEVCYSPNGPIAYEQAILSDQELFNQIENSTSFHDFYRVLNEISFARLSTKKMPDVEEEKKDLVKTIRTQYKDMLKDMAEDYFYQPLEAMLEDMRRVAGPMKVLVQLTIEFIERLQERKEESNIADFSDIEHYALKILVNHEDGNDIPTSAALDLSEQFEEIMIDEYQDSNQVQELILTSISRQQHGEPNIFMVGDVKQSIYKFRLARPELFMEKYESYSEEDSKAQKIELSKNFRSREEVLTSINQIFYKIMQKSLGGIEYTEKVALYPGAAYPSVENAINKTELILVDMTTNEEDELQEDSEVLELSKIELEARAVASRIQRLIKEGYQVTQDGELRPVKYSDIVVLLRTMSNWSEVYTEQLAAQGIPCYSDTQNGYFQTIEIRTMLNYLRILDNPKQDVPMMAVLYSVFGKMTANDLAVMRIQAPNDTIEGKPISFYDAARYCANTEIDGISQKLRAFFTIYDELTKKAQYLSIHELIEEVYRLTGYDLFVYAMPAGETRRSNLNMLIQHAITFEQSSYHGLFQFVRYVERLLKYEIDYGEAGGSGENDNAVRIMSIHKSKGLEFPVVFVGGMGKAFNQMDARAKIVFHPDYGIGPECIDTTERTKIPSLLKKVIQKKMVYDNLGEELRVLYVALTRAKEKLIMIGTLKDAAKEQDKWKTIASITQDHMMFQTIAKAGSYFAFVGPAVMEEPSVAVSVLPMLQLEMFEKEKQLGLPKKVESLNYKHFKETKNEVLKEELKRRISFEYPYKEQAKLPVKTTVSELKKLRDKEESEMSLILYQVSEELTSVTLKEPTIPEFMKEQKEIRGSDRGTLIHKMMECLDFVKTTNYEQIKELAYRLVEKKILNQESVEKVSLKPIVPFLSSDICRRMRSAQQKGVLYREQPFVLGIPANQIQDSFCSEDVVLIQGFIDVYFEEEDGFVLLDYKTDRVTEGEEIYLIERYHKQLDYYAMAIERLRNKKVKEKLIYSFALQKTIGLD